MLHAERKRLKEQAEAEAEGKSFWTKQFAPEVRVKIHRAIVQAVDSDPNTFVSVAQTARGHLLSLGRYFLVNSGTPPEADFVLYINQCNDDMMPSVIEASIEALRDASKRGSGVSVISFVDRVREILNHHRISYDLVEWQMIEFESKEMHQAVVGPTIRLLAGRSGLAGVESAYQKALKEMSGGDPADAITDAGTALQEMFAALGCRGSTLAQQAEAARKKGLLTSHDLKLTDWVTADRSTRGDAHNAAPASGEDGRLTVHVVGSLILRLAADPRRAAPR